LLFLSLFNFFLSSTSIFFQDQPTLVRIFNQDLEEKFLNLLVEKGADLKSARAALELKDNWGNMMFSTYVAASSSAPSYSCLFAALRNKKDNMVKYLISKKFYDVKVGCFPAELFLLLQEGCCFLISGFSHVGFGLPYSFRLSRNLAANGKRRS
jgi:hypothetical protein